jgi:hypothetical protein
MDFTRPSARIALWLGAGLALALAAAAYFRPEFVVDLANRIVLCF